MQYLANESNIIIGSQIHVGLGVVVVVYVMSKCSFIWGEGSGGGLGDEQVLIYIGGGGSGGGLGENSCSNEGTVFCSHRKFNSNTGCHCDILKTPIIHKHF